MSEYDNLCDPETEEEFQARMRDEEQAHLDRERYEDAVFDNLIFDPEVDWNAGEIVAMAGGPD